MTLYETIFVRRQVRKYHAAPLDEGLLEDILAHVLEADQLEGQHAEFKLAGPEEVTSGQLAPHYLLAYCDKNSAAYANVGYVLEEATLYLQSIGLGSGWFNNVRPKDKVENFCFTLAFGRTDVPLRNGTADFKRLPIEEISPVNNAVAEAVRLAPSAINSQPWKLEFEDDRVIVRDFGRGLTRAILRNRLNKIDVGIATKHAVLALEHEGREVYAVIPNKTSTGFAVSIQIKQ